MKSPIINSILKGNLKPSINTIKKDFDGETHFVTYTEEDIIDIIMEKCTGLKKPDDFVNPKKEVDFKKLANIFCNVPNDKHKIENLYSKHLSDFVVLDTDCSTNQTNEMGGQERTELIIPIFPPNIDFDDIQPKNPFEKFYLGLIKTEANRIKLALSDYAETCRDDSFIRNEVEDTLKNILQYTKECTNHPLPKLFLVEEISMDEIEKFDDESNIFPTFKLLLTKLYFEIVLMFKQILHDGNYRQFDDFIYECYGKYPTQDQTNKYKIAEFIQNAQLAINNGNDAFPLLEGSYKIAELNCDNKHLFDTIIALENYAYMQRCDIKYPSLKELFSLSPNKIIKDTKQRINDKLIDITNPREIILMLEEEKEQLSYFVEHNYNFNSIPRKILKYIDEQILMYQKDISTPLTPIPKTKESNLNVKQKNSKKNPKQHFQTALKHINYLSGCNSNNEKIMSDVDYNNLVGYINQFLTNCKIPSIKSKLHTNIQQNHIRYTFYLIYKDLKLKKPNRKDWASFIHEVFDTFKNVDINTIYKKFAQKPKSYDD